MTTTTQATGLGIRHAGPDDETTVATTVAAAFHDDPVLVWLVPDPVRRQEVLVPMFRLYAEAYLRLGETYLTADGNGAALWLPPGEELLTPEQEEVFGEAAADLMGRDFRLPDDGPPLWRMWRDPK
jgi:hypothetical protein